MFINFGIDCAPGAIRPDKYAKEVFDHLSIEPFEAESKLFGAWTWTVEVSDDFNYDSFNDWMQATMDFHYTSGHIRGAKWNKLSEEDNEINKYLSMILQNE